ATRMGFGASTRFERGRVSMFGAYSGTSAGAPEHTGFRLDLRGSGTFFGVEPDFSCNCKAIANGYALSACLGREALRGAAERLFFTGSYFTSAVPMAAA